MTPSLAMALLPAPGVYRAWARCLAVAGLPLTWGSGRKQQHFPPALVFQLQKKTLCPCFLRYLLGVEITPELWMCGSQSPFSERALFVPFSAAWAGEVLLPNSQSSCVTRSGCPGPSSSRDCAFWVSIITSTVPDCCGMGVTWFNLLFPFCIPSPHLHLGFRPSRQASGSCSNHVLWSRVTGWA